MSPGPRNRFARRWLSLGLLGGLLASASLWAAEAAPRAADTVISPQANGPVAARPGDAPSVAYFVFVALCLGGGAWLWVRAKGRGVKNTGSAIVIDETRPLGNRQYLVLTSCRGRSFLVGVSQGRIDVIAEVPPAANAP